MHASDQVHRDGAAPLIDDYPNGSGLSFLAYVEALSADAAQHLVRNTSQHAELSVAAKKRVTPHVCGIRQR